MQEGGDAGDMASVNCDCANPKGFNFAASFFVTPNLIDFNMVFTNWDPSNVGVLLTCLTLIILYIPIAVWARRQDKKDIIQVW